MAERKMADALDELYNDGVKAKMKDFIIENIDTIVAQLAGKYLTQSDAQSQFASINTALSGKLGTTATAASASKVIGGTITLSGSVTGSGSFNSAGNVNITTSGGGATYSTGTASTTGITKLYTSTGSSIDGTMTRQAITNELNTKANSSALTIYATTSALDSLQSTVNSKANSSDLAAYGTISKGTITRTYDNRNFNYGIWDNHMYLENIKSSDASIYEFFGYDNNSFLLKFKVNGTAYEYRFKSDGLYGPNGKIG